MLKWLARVALILPLPLLGCATAPGDAIAIPITVRKGPISPVEMEGTPNSAPVEGARVAIRGEGFLRRSYRTDATGRAVAELGPGRYEAQVTECPGALTLPAAESLDVVGGEQRQLDFECDTGIR